MKSIKYLIIACIWCISISSGFSQSLTITISNIKNSCEFSYDGSILAYCSNSENSNLTWTLSPRFSGITKTISGQTGFFGELSPDIYTITAKDDKGNTGTTTAEVKSINATVSSTKDVTCYGGSDGSITFTASNTSYLDGYLLYDDNRNYWRSQNGVFSGLPAGTYQMSCDRSRSDIIIKQPDKVVDPTVSSVSNVVCNNGNSGKIIVTSTGGTGAISYSINPSVGTQSPAGTFNNLTAGRYLITATDAEKNCTVISQNVTQPAAYTYNPTITNVKCKGGSDGSIVVNATGGTGQLTYFLIPDVGIQSTRGTFTNLKAGSYTINVQDDNSCFGYYYFNITEPSQPITFSKIVSNNLKCNGGTDGSIIVTTENGNGAVKYDISPNIGTQSSPGNFVGLSAGTYNITATDENGCSATIQGTLTEPAAIGLSKTQTNVLCNGASTGAIDLTVSGETTGYTYKWSNDATTQDLTNVKAGTYTVTVTDANSCTASTSATITEPTALTLNKGLTNVLCNGASTGAIDLTVTGGTQGYTYKWSNGTTTEDLTNVKAGTYSVTVTDANSCTASTSVTITEPTALSLNKGLTNVLCNGASTGVIDLTVSGGTPSYTYKWSNDATTQDLTNIKAGTYTVTVTDANGCIATTTATISEPTALTLSYTQTNVLCKSASTGAIDLTVSGGIPSYTYKWSNGATTQDISNIKAGTYTVTVTDANLCTATLTTTITENSAVVANAGSCKYVYYGYGSNCTNLSASATGGGGTYTYKWSSGATTATTNVCPTKTTTYTVTATDQNKCTGTSSVTVEVIDVTCQKTKVKVCHDGMTLCVDKIGVPDHLAHGDKLGTCGTTACGLTLRSVETNLTAHSNVLSIEYYPNPIDDRLNIQLEQVTEGVVQFEVYDMMGKMVKKENRNLTNGYNETSLDVFNLTTGIYLLKVRDSNNQNAVIKIIKQ